MHKNTIRYEPSYKQLEIKTNRRSFLCGNRNGHHTRVYYLFDLKMKSHYKKSNSIVYTDGCRLNLTRHVHRNKMYTFHKLRIYVYQILRSLSVVERKLNIQLKATLSAVAIFVLMGNLDHDIYTRLDIKQIVNTCVMPVTIST
jgi:hypothetical protein